MPPTEDEAGLTRLERRVARERRARIEAESIAERVTRELYETVQKLTRSTNVLELLGAVSAIANEAPDMLAAIEDCVRLVCERTGWSLGHAYVREAGAAEVLVGRGLWHPPTDRQDRFRVATETTRFSSGLGLPGRAMATQRPAWIEDLAQDANFPRNRVAVECGLRAGAAFPVVVGGEVRAVLEFFSPVSAPPDETLLTVMGHVGQHLARVVEREDAASRLLHQALHDDLTGLPNRALLRDRLDRALARVGRFGATVDLLFIDVDDFKAINDRLGHAAGDAVLAELGRRLLACVRSVDTVARPGGPTVARLGGDEFAVVLEDCAEPTIVAERMLDALRAPVVFEGGEIFVGGSIGVARGADSPGGAEALLHAADVAMHVAKRVGKGGVEQYDRSMHDEVRVRNELALDLRRALADDQLLVRFQPEISLATGRVIGAEALLRWQHPTHGLVAPDVFIPLAEETGRIVEIGGWVLHAACATAASWGDGLFVAVNVSGRQLRDGSFVEVVKAALGASGLAPERLCCEITESVLMENPEVAARTLQAVRDLGVAVAVDDFGTGYSSLAALKRYPVDWLKIDRSFVRGLPGDDDDAQIVRAVLRLAQHLQLRVVAEGVETAEQLAALREYGCDVAQGYLIGRPGPAEDLLDLVGSGQTW